MTPTVPVLAALSLLFMVAGAGAQPPVRSGDRVRVQALERVFSPVTATPSALTTRVGRLTRTTRDSLWLDAATARYALSREDVVTIEVARRDRRSAVRGAIIGGVVTGVVLGWYGCDFLRNCDDINTPSRESRIIGGVLPGALAGALVARVWRKPERWVEAWADP
jgi:hypothetical protein